MEEWNRGRNRLLSGDFLRFVRVVVVHEPWPGDRQCIADLFFHVLAGLERYDVLRFDIDRLIGPRVSCPAGFPPFHLKYAEFTQFDATVRRQRFDDRIERHLDDPFDLELGQAGLVRYLFDDFFFGHGNGPRAALQAGWRFLSLKSNRVNG